MAINCLTSSNNALSLKLLPVNNVSWLLKMLVLKILLGLVFCFWILFLWRRRKYYMLAAKLPGPLGLPFIGVLYKFKSLEDILVFTADLKKNYVSPILTWVGTLPLFCVCDPQTVQDILTSPHCVNKATIYDIISDIVGNGLLTLANPEWSVHRKLLNPSFSPEILRSFVPIFNEKTKAIAKVFEVSCGGASINMLPIMQRLTMNMALQTTMGLKQINGINSSQDEIEEKLFRYYHYFSEKVVAFVIMPWLRLNIVQKLLPSLRTYTTSKRDLRKFYINLIREKLEFSSTTDLAVTKSTTTKDRDDNTQKKQKYIFIDQAIDLMKSGKFTAEHVEDHSNHIVAGAFDTTATTIAHALILLAMNPPYQEIAFEELFALYADRDDVNVTYEDLQHLVYLEMAINESMRLIPTVPLIVRTATSDVRLSRGVVLPQGVQIIISLFDLHRDESVWGPNALIFDPENFLPQNLREKHSYAFIPFTKGIRNCIGWRYGMNATKIVLAILLRKYRFTTTSKFEDLRYEPAVTMRLIDPPLLKLHLREK